MFFPILCCFCISDVGDNKSSNVKNLEAAKDQSQTYSIQEVNIQDSEFVSLMNQVQNPLVASPTRQVPLPRTNNSQVELTHSSDAAHRIRVPTSLKSENKFLSGSKITSIDRWIDTHVKARGSGKVEPCIPNEPEIMRKKIGSILLAETHKSLGINKVKTLLRDIPLLEVILDRTDFLESFSSAQSLTDALLVLPTLFYSSKKINFEEAEDDFFVHMSQNPSKMCKYAQHIKDKMEELNQKINISYQKNNFLTIMRKDNADYKIEDFYSINTAFGKIKILIIMMKDSSEENLETLFWNALRTAPFDNIEYESQELSKIKSISRTTHISNVPTFNLSVSSFSPLAKRMQSTESEKTLRKR